MIWSVIPFIDSLKDRIAPELNKINKANKATVGTFFSIRNPQNAMRSFGAFISKIDWSKSESLKELFLPFMYLGQEKPTPEEYFNFFIKFLTHWDDKMPLVTIL